MSFAKARGPLGALMAVVAAVALLVGCTKRVERAPAAAPAQDPGAMIEAQAAQMSRDGPYRDPDQAERTKARDAVALLLSAPDDLASQDKAFSGLGFATAHGFDSTTGRQYSMFSMSATTEPAFGMLLVDRSSAARVVFEVPHPGFDTNTDKLGVSLYRLVPGSILLVAGAHRAAADGAADVAHNNKSMFHVLATELAKHGLPQIQLHGFADQNLPDAQVVVSAGGGSVTPLVNDVARGLQAGGLVVCRAWMSSCGRLEGTTNEQGNAAAELGAQFVHVELSWGIRRDPDRRDLVARTIAGCVPTQ